MEVIEMLKSREVSLALLKKSGKYYLCQRRFLVEEITQKEWEQIKKKYLEFDPDVVYASTGEPFAKVFRKNGRQYLLSSSGAVVSVPASTFERKFLPQRMEVGG
ncbi:MAG TPA: hypothetical protein EYP20_01615 [Aigarchaeota archaeon]|nr:hypothetical protein [Aigarchaeota archaeon]